jgi:flagellar FliJ protein
MSRANKLLPVKEMAQRQTENELAKLGQLNGALSRARSQLDELMHYRNEYLSRFRRSDIQTLPAKKNLELRAFLTHLDQAIQGQQQQVQQSQERVNLQQQQWQHAKNKEQAIDNLMIRYEAETALKQLKKEQRDSDEHTNAIWLRRHRNH